MGCILQFGQELLPLSQYCINGQMFDATNFEEEDDRFAESEVKKDSAINLVT